MTPATEAVSGLAAATLDLLPQSVYIVDRKQARYIDCKDVELSFGPQFVADIVNRTEHAQNQEQALLAAELVLKAQKVATPPISA